GHLADAADVLLAVGGAEAEVLVQPVADVVAVQHVSEATRLDEGVFESERRSALARAGQSGEPERGGRVLQQRRPLLRRDMALMPGNVGRLALAHPSSPQSK